MKKNGAGDARTGDVGSEILLDAVTAPGSRELGHQDQDRGGGKRNVMN